MTERDDDRSGDLDSASVVLFDGICVLCSAVVRFIARHDPGARFRFAALGSPAGRALLADAPRGRESIVLLEPGGVRHMESDAALRIVSNLVGPVHHLAVLRIVPRPLRDVAYRVVAASRYRLFGRRETCVIPEPWLRDRFLAGGAE